MKQIILLIFTVFLMVGCSDAVETTSGELSENAQNFSPHGDSYTQLVDFYNAVQDALNEELEREEIIEAFDELEEEKRELQSSLVEVEFEELSDSAETLKENSDARETLLDDEALIYDEIASQLEDAETMLGQIVTRGYSTRGEALIEAALERLETQRNLLDGKYEIVERERKLYELFADSETTQEMIDEQTSNISEAYVEVAERSEALGKQTEALNGALETLFEYMN